ncbi:MAG: hypothetical protein R3F36_00465 [Candidatus Competibacteraceae bacterium]
MVEVDKEHDDLVAGAIRHRQRLVEAIQQQPAVGQTGQRIVVRQLANLRLGLFLRGDVGHKHPAR